MEKLKKSFKENFGVSIPESMLFKGKLVSLDERKPEESFLLGSPAAAEKPCFVQDDIPRFFDSCPEGYYLIGYWGHGVNSNAFYYQRIDSWSKVFLRLGFGGLYTNKKRDAETIKEFLSRYFDFERRIKNKVKSLRVLESMGQKQYNIVTSDDKVFEVQESLARKPDFDNKFRELFKHITKKGR